MKDYASRQRDPKKRFLGIGLLLGLHLLVLLAINSGMGRDLLKKINSPVETLLLDEVKPDIPPPPPPPPPPQKQLPPPPDYVPPVEVRVQSAPAANAIAAISNTPQPIVAPTPVPVAAAPAPPPAPPAPPAPPVRIAPVINVAANCEKPDYPSVSRRQQEEGTVQLKFLIGIDGRVLESETEKSSGYRRLDEAARSGLSKCQFKPGTLGGKPEQSWATVRFVWRLEE